MPKLFGTDGVRGVANIDLTCELAFKLGKAGTYVLLKGKKKGKVLVGKDTRISSDMLEAALISGICSAGCDALKLGVVPTPCISYLVKELKASCGIMISASHNPVEDNGIKFFDKDGFKLKQKQEEEIESFIFEREKDLPSPAGIRIGKIIDCVNEIERYINFLKSKFNSLKLLKIVIDCANGAASCVIPRLFQELNTEVCALNCDFSGYNINKECGALYPEVTQKAVLNSSANMGISFDGDADRVVLIDEKGNILDGDDILTILGIYFKEKQMLKNNLIVSTVMSNLGLEKNLEKFGINLVRTKVGDHNVVMEMKRKNCILGGEKSGHIILLGENSSSDGLLTALTILKIMSEKNKKLSELRENFIKFPQILINVAVRDKGLYDGNSKIKKFIKSKEKEIGENGRIFVRPSGTENIIRIMVEGERKEEIENIANQIKEVVKKELK